MNLTLLRFLRRNLPVFLLLTILMVSYRVDAQSLPFLRADTTDSDKTMPRYKNLEFIMQYGTHFPTGVKALGETIEVNPFVAIQARLGWQGYGRKRWQQFFSYPTYGIGFNQFIFIPQENILGNPNSIYGFFNAPFSRKKKSPLTYDVEVGLSYNFLGYDPESNPEQTAIGSDVNVHFAVGLEKPFRLSNRLDGAAGIKFTHFSNGRTRTPNKGVNIFGIHAKLINHLIPYQRTASGDKVKLRESAVRPTFIKHVMPEFQPKFELNFVASAGVATSAEDFTDRETYYPIASITADVARHYGFTGKYGIGFDFFYDESLKVDYNADFNGDVPTSKLMYGGIHIGHELLVHRFTVITQAGFAFRNVKGRGSSYFRVGARYDLTNTVFARVALKTPEGFAADFIEWGIGMAFYKLQKKKD